ncbi:hypothetical protein [Parerythrobacter aestuarii]|uniref:hypothetical protein n=1 Tax=Parerythrobacter aestuarii TaxID=3020909 RepID=UPI0024DE2746|nr:hypothetical protein [Parerythrobacter aestuarii]
MAEEQDAPGISDALLDPAQGFLHHGFLINPDAKLVVNVTASTYGTDIGHPTWKILCLFNEKLTHENARSTVTRNMNGHEVELGFATLDSPRLLDIWTTARYPDRNLWLFIMGNSLGKLGEPRRDFFVDPDVGDFDGTELYRYVLRSVLRIMRETTNWEEGEFRLFVPGNHRERLGGEWGETIRPRNMDEDFCEYLQSNERND